MVVIFVLVIQWMVWGKLQRLHYLDWGNRCDDL